MPNHERSLHGPPRRNRCKRLEDEAAPGELRVRNRQAARAELAPAPQRDVEVEHAGAPSAPRTAAEVALDGFETLEHYGRIKLAFNQRDRIGKVAPGAASGAVEDDRGGVEQAELQIQPRDRRRDDAGRRAVAAMRPVGSDRHRVKERRLGQSLNVFSQPPVKLRPPVAEEAERGAVFLRGGEVERRD